MREFNTAISTLRNQGAFLLQLASKRLQFVKTTQIY